MIRSAVVDLRAFETASGKTRRVVVEGRDFYSLSYRYYGQVLLKTRDTEFVSQANSITFMPKGIGYETEIMEDTKMAVVHFKLDQDIPCHEPSVLEVKNPDIPLLFEKLIRSFRVDTPIDFRCMAYFYELLAVLESIAELAQEEHIPHKIAQARELMLRRFSDPCLSISSLSESLGISTSYLRREFAKVYGKSPAAYLREMRIGNAKNLLQSEYLSIARIAELSGFSSESYFIQVFHKTVGLSPDRYRRQLYKK